MVKSDKPEVIEQDVFGGKEKAAPGVVGRACETIEVVAELTGLIQGHIGHKMAADNMGDIYCYDCEAWLSDADADAQDEADDI